MNILLTGATGFLGSRIAAQLKRIMEDNDRLILLTSSQIEGYLCINHKNYSYNVLDFLEAGIDHIDIVIHAGWFCARSNNEKNNIENNFLPVVNTNYLLLHLPNIPSKFIFCSSCNVYGGTGTFDVYKKGRVIDEDTPIQLVDQYAISKYVTELFIKDWALEHNSICHILRIGPLFGIGDKRKDYLIGRMIYNAAMGSNLSIYTEPTMQRNYLYVDDCVKFIINSIKLKEDVGPINLVSVNNLKIIDIAKLICEVTGNKVKYSVKVPNKVLGKDMVYSNEKCQKYLGNEEFTFEDGIKLTYDWNVEYYCST